MEERKKALKRCHRLLEKGSLEELLSVEVVLRQKLEKSKGPSSHCHNPEGLRVGGDCKVCGGKRPPAADSQPWHQRRNSQGELLAKSAVCAPCIWSVRNQKDRSEWPHWEKHRLGELPKAS